MRLRHSKRWSARACLSASKLASSSSAILASAAAIEASNCQGYFGVAVHSINNYYYCITSLVKVISVYTPSPLYPGFICPSFLEGDAVVPSRPAILLGFVQNIDNANGGAESARG